MGEILKGEVRIPNWMFGIILSIMLIILGFNASYAGTKQEVQQNTKEIEKLQKDKADKEFVVRVYDKMDKIETLLIDHMREKK